MNKLIFLIDKTTNRFVPYTINSKDIPRYCDTLIEAYGKKPVQDMLQRQIIYRKNLTNKLSIANKRKYQEMLRYILKI